MSQHTFSSYPWPTTRTRSSAWTRKGPALSVLLGVALVVGGWKHAAGEKASATTVSSSSPAAECRDSAPDDPYTEPGATAEAAYRVCALAVARMPGDAELRYLLALSALQIDRIEEAEAAFHAAAGLGSCPALHYLAESAWYRGKDADAAEDLYRRAAACGDSNAAKEVFRPEVFAASAYPAYIEALYHSDIGLLNRAPRFVSASYVLGLYESLSEQYLGRSFDPAWTAGHFGGGEILYRLRAAEAGDAPDPLSGWAYARVLPLAYAIVFPEQSFAALETTRDTIRKAGHADLIRLIENYTPTSVVPYRVVQGVAAFATQRQNLLESIRQIAPGIHTIDDLRRRAWQPAAPSPSGSK